MAKQHHHIMIGDTPYCDMLGTMAGQHVALKSGVDICGHVSGAAAKRAAQALRPYYRAGRVKIVAGCCPHSAV